MKSETAILTMKKFTVFLNSGRLCITKITREFPTKLSKKTTDEKTIWIILTEKESLKPYLCDCADPFGFGFKACCLCAIEDVRGNDNDFIGDVFISV